MYERQKQCERRYNTNQAVLIIPFVIDDGKCFPPEVQQMQLKPIHDYANPYLQAKSRAHFRFTEVLKKECPRIESALDSAPPFEAAWETLAHDQFRELFRIQTERQATLPALSLINTVSSSER